MRTSCLLLALTGCPYPDPDCAGQYERNDAGTCVAVEQSGGIDSGDSGTPMPTGTYSGPIHISIVANTGDLVIEDSCSGQVGFELEDGVLSDGEVNCAFPDGGTVAVIIGADPFVGTLAGQVGADDTISGDFFLNLGAFGELDTVWTGSLSDSSVTGELGGQFVYVLGALEVPVDYVGDFTASR